MAAVRALMWATEGREGIILCGREFMNSLADSSFAEVKAAIVGALVSGGVYAFWTGFKASAAAPSIGSAPGGSRYSCCKTGWQTGPGVVAAKRAKRARKKCFALGKLGLFGMD